jgi:hypothetical protein
MRPTRLAAAGVATLLTLGLAGCSDQVSPKPASLDSVTSSSPATPSASASSAEPAAEEPTADASQDAASGQGYDAEQLVAAMKAAFADHRSTHLVMRTNGVAEMRAVGDVDYTHRSPAMRMRMTMPAMGVEAMEMRVVDGTFYLSMPPATPKGKFLAFRTDDPNSPLAAMGDLTTQMDPMRSFDAFEHGLTDVEFVGAEQVGGETLDHYRLTVDTAAALKGMKQQRAAGMPETISYELWLDGEDLMRKVVFDISGMSMSMEMTRWGEPVKVSAPPRAAVVETPGA